MKGMQFTLAEYSPKRKLSFSTEISSQIVTDMMKQKNFFKIFKTTKDFAKVLSCEKAALT